MRGIVEIGNGFIEVVDLNGARQIIRVTAIQAVADSDEMQNEAVIVVAGKAMEVQASVDDFSRILRVKRSARSRPH